VVATTDIPIIHMGMGIIMEIMPRRDKKLLKKLSRL
jgi:hypothetical protein